MRKLVEYLHCSSLATASPQGSSSSQSVNEAPDRFEKRVKRNILKVPASALRRPGRHVAWPDKTIPEAELPTFVLDGVEYVHPDYATRVQLAEHYAGLVERGVSGSVLEVEALGRAYERPIGVQDVSQPGTGAPGVHALTLIQRPSDGAWGCMVGAQGAQFAMGPDALYQAAANAMRAAEAACGPDGGVSLPDDVNKLRQDTAQSLRGLTVHRLPVDLDKALVRAFNTQLLVYTTPPDRLRSGPRLALWRRGDNHWSVVDVHRQVPTETGMQPAVLLTPEPGPWALAQCLACVAEEEPRSNAGKLDVEDPQALMTVLHARLRARDDTACPNESTLTAVYNHVSKLLHRFETEATPEQLASLHEDLNDLDDEYPHTPFSSAQAEARVLDYIHQQARNRTWGSDLEAVTLAALHQHRLRIWTVDGPTLHLTAFEQPEGVPDDAPIWDLRYTPYCHYNPIVGWKLAPDETLPERACKFELPNAHSRQMRSAYAGNCLYDSIAILMGDGQSNSRTLRREVVEHWQQILHEPKRTDLKAQALAQALENKSLADSY